MYIFAETTNEVKFLRVNFRIMPNSCLLLQVFWLFQHSKRVIIPFKFVFIIWPSVLVPKQSIQKFTLCVRALRSKISKIALYQYFVEPFSGSLHSPIIGKLADCCDIIIMVDGCLKYGGLTVVFWRRFCFPFTSPLIIFIFQRRNWNFFPIFHWDSM